MGMAETFTYDPNGNMLTKTDCNGDTIIYTYDVNNRLTTNVKNATELTRLNNA